MPKHTKAEYTLRRARALELRVAGKSVAEIARELDTEPRYVGVMLRSAVADIDATRWLEHEVTIDLARLDRLWEVYYPRAVGRFGNDADLDAAHFLLKVLERRAKLLGLDAPKRIDIRAIVTRWAEEQGLDPETTVDVVATMLPMLTAAD